MFYLDVLKVDRVLHLPRRILLPHLGVSPSSRCWLRSDGVGPHGWRVVWVGAIELFERVGHAAQSRRGAQGAASEHGPRPDVQTLV
jgi:hypothetical protein